MLHCNDVTLQRCVSVVKRIVSLEHIVAFGTGSLVGIGSKKKMMDPLKSRGKLYM